MDGSVLFILSIILIVALTAVFIGVMTNRNKPKRPDEFGSYTSTFRSGPTGGYGGSSTGGSSSGGRTGSPISADGSYRIKFDKKPEPAKSERTDRRSGKTETPPAPNQNTIYKFRARCETALCPRCDGENAPGANLCHICGQQLSMKGAYSL